MFKIMKRLALATVMTTLGRDRSPVWASQLLP